MSKKEGMSRRQFVASAVSAAAVSSLPSEHLFDPRRARRDVTIARDTEQTANSTNNPSWRDQGVLNLTKSLHAKLRNVPVHAVTITAGFWGQRRETNVNKSIPSMEKLLEANGRMDNFLRLAGKSAARCNRVTGRICER